MIQIRLHRKSALPPNRFLPALGKPPETFIKLQSGTVGCVCDLAGNGQAHVGAVIILGVVIISTTKFRIAFDGQNLWMRPCDLIPRGLSRGCDGDHRSYPIGKSSGPLQGAVSTD